MNEQRVEAYHKLQHLYWIPVWKWDMGCGLKKGEASVRPYWKDDCGPFYWGPKPPSERIANPNMEWGHPNFETFMKHWARALGETA